MAEKKYVCSVCGYVYTGDKAPEECPQCHQKGVFVEEKKGLNTNKNSYTFAYATVIVVLVAVLLAVVSQVLSPRQQANVLLDRGLVSAPCGGYAGREWGTSVRCEH